MAPQRVARLPRRWYVATSAHSRCSEFAPQKVVPISVFVSRKLSRLFVRQGLTPVLDIPVEIHNPEEPLGTHVFTAMEFRR